MSTTKQLLNAAMALRRRQLETNQPSEDQDQAHLAIWLIRQVLEERRLEYLELVPGKLRLSRDAWHWSERPDKWQRIRSWEQICATYPAEKLLERLIEEIKRLQRAM